VAQREREERATLDPGFTLEQRDLDIGERDEGALGGVEVVGEPAAVTIGGQPENPGDPVAIGLHDDALVTVVHGDDDTGRVPKRRPVAPPPRWWTIRPAHNSKPATYRCPLCGGQLPALMDHVLIKPESDSERRRHAHSECVVSARRAGRLPTREEYERGERERRRAAGELPRPWWQRLIGRGR
jgi:hypothetical protein